MSYRIYLHKWDENIEIRDETPISKMEIVKWTDEEYPDYLVDKKSMLSIIEFYQQKLHQIAKETFEDIELQWQKRMFWYLMERYFGKVDKDNMIINTDQFFLQYFYLVEIYKNTDWEKTKLLITHW